MRMIGSMVGLMSLALCLGGCGEATPPSEQTHRATTTGAAPVLLVTGANISGANGMAQLTMIDNARLSVRPNTTFRVENYATRADSDEGALVHLAEAVKRRGIPNHS